MRLHSANVKQISLKTKSFKIFFQKFGKLENISYICIMEIEMILQPYKQIFGLVLKQLEECVSKNLPLDSRIEVLESLSRQMKAIDKRFIEPSVRTEFEEKLEDLIKQQKK